MIKFLMPFSVKPHGKKGNSWPIKKVYLSAISFRQLHGSKALKWDRANPWEFSPTLWNEPPLTLTVVFPLHGVHFGLSLTPAGDQSRDPVCPISVLQPIDQEVNTVSCVMR